MLDIITAAKMMGTAIYTTSILWSVRLPLVSAKGTGTVTIFFFVGGGWVDSVPDVTK